MGRPNAVRDADALIADMQVTLAGRPAYTLPSDPTWLEDPYGDPTRVYEYQSLFFVLDALLAYRSSGEDRYLDAAQLHIERWASDHSRVGFEGSWGDHIMANRTRILLLAWELLRRRDPASDTVDSICSHLGRHGDRLSDPDFYTVNSNHGYFQDEALISLGFTFDEHQSASEWLDLGLERVAAQVQFAVSAEGVHREHSPSYHAGMQLRFAGLARLLAALGSSPRIDLDAVVRSMYDFIAYGVLPTGRAPLIGDSSRWFGSTTSPAITPEALYSLSGGQQGTPPAVVDRVYPESGYAFFRDAWHPPETFSQTVYVAFVAAAFSRVHKHCDDLSVLLHGYGESWLTDSGFWSYDRDDLYQDLAVSPAGHNVVEVDGQSYYDALPADRTITNPLRLLTFSESTPSVATVRGEHRLNAGVLFKRELQYTRPGNLVVTDALVAEDGVEHGYTLYWHISPDKVVAQIAPGVFLVTTMGSAGPTMQLNVESSTALWCEIIQGATDPYQGWRFPAFLQVEEAPVIACHQRARDATFSSSIQLYPG